MPFVTECGVPFVTGSHDERMEIPPCWQLYLPQTGKLSDMSENSSDEFQAEEVVSSYVSRRQRREEESGQPRLPWKRGLSIALQVIAWTLAGLFALIIVLTVLVPRVIGAEPYTVISGSMEPTIPTGSIVVSQHVGADDVAFGDVITYQLKSGEPLTVTHRVVGVDIVEGQTRYRTQGDANNAEDPLPVRPEQIRGVVIYHIPFVGYLGQLVPMGNRQTIATVIGIGLIGYAVIMLTRSLVDQRRKRRLSSTHDSAE
ncbi:signal peptidase I [Brevibacterium sp. S111]|nr:signal peptidase I [Brevibacterium sp. S111]